MENEKNILGCSLESEIYGNLLSGKARTAIGNQKSKPSCCSCGLRESESFFARFSNIRRTIPITMQLLTIVSQRSQLKGFLNTHMSLSFLGLTTITVPDSEYGSVKSTYFVRSAKIVVSPTTISKVYFIIKTNEKLYQNDCILIHRLYMSIYQASQN